MLFAGVGPGSGRPVPSNRLIALTVMSWSQSIWQDNLTPVRSRAARRSRSAAVIFDGSPSTNSTRHVVQRALPPHACMTSTPASSSIASTNRFAMGTSNVSYPSTVSCGMAHSTVRAVGIPPGHPGVIQLLPRGLVAHELLRGLVNLPGSQQHAAMEASGDACGACCERKGGNRGVVRRIDLAP